DLAAYVSCRLRLSIDHLDELTYFVERARLCGIASVEQRGIRLYRSVTKTITEYFRIVVVRTCVVDGPSHTTARQVRVGINCDEISVELPTRENAGCFANIFFAIHDIVTFARTGWKCAFQAAADAEQFEEFPCVIFVWLALDVQ